jgi:hypothetical protein
VVEEAIPSLLVGLVGYLMVEVKVVAGGLILGAPPIFPIVVKMIGRAEVAPTHVRDDAIIIVI